ncbi:ABC transporter ATP-binding protein [Mesorhizobium hungaricum]|jgi:putative spermidine/putrescine transport system ATP-binding protein|uniref:ABC transporter ATP-binding protein n=1 Tax=Mesorhizobium hungaricum TaxID=1566387 RepID=A0A1C2E3A9_9HYPH|nr:MULTISPECIES: ABC transporter ATP-binding protein [Mesorhizobium]MBN9235829.1 ABC transporter ATP-binding protein [Mesorhizobium sp.]MDQ0333074.1 putative spermidine/putrescine transport system ATP-binding protein [Mesorhizobium sp. YL-MeA3-2017]OCX21490.1 ABC transporter ATP-binding protein [Mesorhizobium hungaricum]
MKSLPITIDSVRKAYGSYVALDDVSLDVRPGEFLTLLGPSGSGKTTLLMALAGFVRPDSGKFLLGDRDITRLAPNRRDIGIVFQNYALFPHMNVLANVEYPLALRKTPKAEARRRALEALARVKLEGLSERNIAALSGGQRQRVALARAIVFEPRVMLMDEPLSALDRNLRETMQYEIRRLHDDLGITTIYVTHDQREALTMSDRVAVMNSGRIQQIDTPQQIYDRPSTRFVAEFMGEANILAPGSVRTIDGGGASRETLMIRAESFHLDAKFVGQDGVALDGTLRAKAFRGENWLLTLAPDGGQEVLVCIPSAFAGDCAELAAGQRLTVYASAAKVHAIPGATA